MEESVQVGPWAAEAFVDYEKLLKVFGAKPLTDSEVRYLERIAGESHVMLRRRVFYSHRDLDVFLSKYESGYRCALYTGRGPSGSTHLGHILPWIFTRWLQEKLGLDLFFQMTDDEKFLHEEKLDLLESNSFAYENSLDLIALGFDYRKTHIIIDTEDIGYLYPIAVRIAKKLTYSTQRATFGFVDSTNVGLIFYPVLQMAVSFLPTELFGEETYVLIPAGIDQDPYWRIARDIAQGLGYPKPSQVHNKLLPGLGPEGKMSSSKPETAVYTTDPPDVGAQKIMRAFTGGQPTIELQKKLGGNPDRCSVYKMYEMLFEDSDVMLQERYWSCRTGSLICGDCKAELASRVRKFLKEFQEKREKARDQVDMYLIRTKFDKPSLRNRTVLR